MKESPFPSSEWCTAHGMHAVSKCTCGKLRLLLVIHRSAGTGSKRAPPQMHRDCSTVHRPELVGWEGTHSLPSLTFVMCWVWQPSLSCLHGISKRGICSGKVKWLLVLMLPHHSKMKKKNPGRLCQVLYTTETVKGENIWLLMIRTTEDSSKNRSNQVDVKQKAVAEVIEVLVWT